MSLKPTVPAGWLRASGYPRGSTSLTGPTTTDRIQRLHSTVTQTMINELLTLTHNGAPVSSVTWSTSVEGRWCFVDLVYGGGGSTIPADDDTQYSVEDSGLAIPIDVRKANGDLYFPDYKTKHNHILACRNDVVGSGTPAFWDTATDLEIDDDDYRWLESPDSLPDEWVILKDKTKKIEAVSIPAPVVVEETFYPSRAQAINKMRKVGLRITPPETFGYTLQWRVGSSNVYQDGRRWRCRTTFEGAEDWDADYIKEPAP